MFINQEKGTYRVSELDFVFHGQSNVGKILKHLTCSQKSIKLDIHATSQTYRVTQEEQHWYTLCIPKTHDAKHPNNWVVNNLFRQRGG